MFESIITEASGSGSNLTKEKRKKMEDLVYNVFKIVDPTGTNTNHYKELFKGMNDKQFDEYMRNIFDNEDEYLIMYIEDYEYSLSLSNVTKALDYIGIPFWEYVIQPYDNMDKENPTISPVRVPVGYTHLKRMQQVGSNKNKGSINASTRSALTGQVTAGDKNGRMGDAENFNYILNGGDDIVKEFMSLRGDDEVMYSEAMAMISEKGYLDMSVLTDKPENKTTLNVVDQYLIGMGIKSDLVTKDLTLVSTLKNKK